MTTGATNDATDAMMFAARDLSEQDRWNEAGRFVSEILALERATRPDGGAETEEGKDAKAREALALAGQLVRAVAGWAVDHVVGVASDAASSAEPTSPDDHRHEARGWSVRVDDGNAETVGRAVLTQLVACNPGALPQAVQRATVAALESLEYGEVLPLAMPARINLHRRLCLLRHQLQALRHVEYRARLPGAKVGRAMAAVAHAYGVEPGTLRTAWKYRVPVELPPGEAERSLDSARRDAAARMVTLPDPHRTGIDLCMRVYANGEADIGPDPYSDAVLIADGRAYQRQLGAEKCPPLRQRKVLRRSRDT